MKKKILSKQHKKEYLSFICIVLSNTLNCEACQNDAKNGWEGNKIRLGRAFRSSVKKG